MIPMSILQTVTCGVIFKCSCIVENVSQWISGHDIRSLNGSGLVVVAMSRDMNGDHKAKNGKVLTIFTRFETSFSCSQYIQQTMLCTETLPQRLSR